jgi:hypothetical protein
MPVFDTRIIHYTNQSYKEITMYLEKIKKEVMEMMEKKYNSPPKPPQNVTDEDIEKKGFMRASHAAAVRKCCGEYGLRVSFREAGKDTIDRIKAGNPCKGHSIANKTVKYAAGSGWNYEAPHGDINELIRFRGLAGFSYPLSRTLAGVWALDGEGTEEKIPLDALTALKDQRRCFTGDYDIYDLIKHNHRILAGTSDERDVLGLLNSAIFNADLARKVKAEKGRRFHAAYSPIRHGAQTSFMDYLLDIGQTGDLRKFPDAKTVRLSIEGKILTIAKHIVLFEDNGTASILNSIARIYQYYKDHDLIEQMPFYYFFNDLRNIRENEERLNEFAADMNLILSGSIKDMKAAAAI